MNIIYFVNYYPPNTGAAALNSSKIVQYLEKFGHSVLVLRPFDMAKSFNTNKALSKKSNVHVSSSLIKFPFSRVFSHLENIIAYLLNLKKKINPDLIMSQYHAFHYASVAGAYVSKKLNVPHVIRSHDIFHDLSIHSLPYRIYNSMIYPRIFNSISKSELFYVVSSELRDYLLQMKKISHTKIKVHHNGIDVSEFYPKHYQNSLKEKFSCENIILFIGLINDNIGLHHFVNSLSNVLKTRKETHLVIIGDGPYRDEVLNIVNQTGISNQVHFLGIMSHEKIPYFINNCDIGVGRITSDKLWTYSIPIKCLEYMACKKPFITTPLSRDVIFKNDVGLTLKRDFNDQDVIDKLTLLIENPKLRNKLGENGFLKIKKDLAGIK